MTHSYENGEINQTELDYLENIFAFDERVLKEIMIEHGQIVTLSSGMSLNNMMEVLNQNDYTRYPVTEEGHKHRFIGFINTKEMLTSMAAGRECRMSDFIHDMLRFSQNASIKDVLIKMQQSRVHMAAVTNEEGTTIGLVTMEDILEEIVGDIRDEAVLI